MPVQILIDENGAVDAIVTVPQMAVEIIATLIRQGDTMILDGVHLEKLSGAALDRQQIDRLCNEICQHYQAGELIVRGARRTTGKSAASAPAARSQDTPTMTSVRLHGWSRGLNKVRLTKLIRSTAGVALNQAHDAVNRLLAGEMVEINFDCSQTASQFAVAARTLGMQADCTSAPESTSVTG
jgi:ribosomal protein L7/L12